MSASCWPFLRISYFFWYLFDSSFTRFWTSKVWDWNLLNKLEKVSFVSFTCFFGISESTIEILFYNSNILSRFLINLSLFKRSLFSHFIKFDCCLFVINMTEIHCFRAYPKNHFQIRLIQVHCLNLLYFVFLLDY